MSRTKSTKVCPLNRAVLVVLIVSGDDSSIFSQLIKIIAIVIKKTGIEVQRIILEPESKNTFPAIALSVLSGLYESENERYLVMPSDHYIPYNKSF